MLLPAQNTNNFCGHDQYYHVPYYHDHLSQAEQQIML